MAVNTQAFRKMDLKCDECRAGKRHLKIKAAFYMHQDNSKSFIRMEVYKATKHMDRDWNTCLSLLLTQNNQVI